MEGVVWVNFHPQPQRVPMDHLMSKPQRLNRVSRILGGVGSWSGDFKEEEDESDRDTEENVTNLAGSDSEEDSDAEQQVPVRMWVCVCVCVCVRACEYACVCV